MKKDMLDKELLISIITFLNIKISGIIIDAVKHIYPKDLVAILKKIKDNFGG